MVPPCQGLVGLWRCRRQNEKRLPAGVDRVRNKQTQNKRHAYERPPRTLTELSFIFFELHPNPWCHEWEADQPNISLPGANICPWQGALTPRLHRRGSSTTYGSQEMGGIHGHGHGIVHRENRFGRRSWCVFDDISCVYHFLDESSVTGFGIGAFFSLMSASFAYEDPLLRQQTQVGLNTTQKASQIMKEMGKGMWTSGKGFGKVGALFAGIECVIESVSIHHFQISR